MKRFLAVLGATACAAIGLSTAAVAAGAATPASSPAASTATSVVSTAPAPSCSTAHWQPEVQGTPPNFAAGERGGVYLWHTDHGFFLRVTHRNDNRAIYSGTITSNRPMGLKKVDLEGVDAATLSADHKTIVFRFADYGHIDGIDFTAPCTSTLHVGHLTVGNAALTASRVYLGETRHHPRQTPFTLHRV